MKKHKILKDKQSISTFTVKLIVDKWDENEAIMNLVSRVRELDVENGELKAYISELKESKKKKKTINQRLKLDELDKVVKKQSNEIKYLNKKLDEFKI